jgi:hypothetical protein
MGSDGLMPRANRPAAAETVPRLSLTKAEAAAALGMSISHFERHVQPHVACVYSGSLRLFPVRALDRWLDEQARRLPPAA